MMHKLLFVAGILLLLMGVLFIGQGTGIFPYPSYSFMISDIGWAYRGIAIAVLGAIAILLSRKMQR
jgi:hypothetical protein